MKSILMRTSLIYFLIVLFIPNVTSAELKTFTKEYTYQASEIDSKVSCRSIALEQVKRLLLEELGSYIESETIVQNYELSKDQIKVITAGIVKTNIIDERWDGQSYWVQVAIACDPNEVSKAIDRLLTNADVFKRLNIAQKKADDAIKEIERLKKKHKTTKSSRKKIEIKKEYESEVNTINNTDEWRKAFNILDDASQDVDRGNYDSAILAVQQIIDKKTSDKGNLAAAYTTLGVAYFKKGMFHEAIVTLQKVSKVYADSAFVPISHGYLGNIYFEMKSYQMAISEFSKAIAMISEEKKKAMERGLSGYSRLSGIGSFQYQMDNSDERIADNLMNIARAYISIAGEGKGLDENFIIPNEAIIAIKKVKKIKPISPAILETANAFSTNDKDDSTDIIDWCDKIIRVKPNISKVYLIRGGRYLLLKNFHQSVKDFSKAIELNPNDAECYERRALSYVDLGIYNEAMKDYNRAIELNPTFAMAYFGRGFFVRDYLGRNVEQAIEDIKIAARLGNKGAQEILRSQRIDW